MASGKGKDMLPTERATICPLDIDAILNHYRSYGDAFDDGMDTFIDLLFGGAEPFLPSEDAQDLSAAYMDWFLFDYVLANGKTPLENYIAAPPASVSDIEIDRLRQAEKTQLSSMFMVEDVSDKTADMTLRDIVSGKIYRVIDSDVIACFKPVRSDMVVARIACIDGCWYIPTVPLGFVPQGIPEEVAQGFGDLAKNEPSERLRFLDLVRLRFRTDLEELDEDGGSSEMFLLSPEQQKDELVLIEEDYADLCRVFNIGFTWDDLIASVFREDGSYDAASLARGVFAEAGDSAGSMSEDDKQDLIDILSDAWDLLPHKRLDGKSPVQVEQEQRVLE